MATTTTTTAIQKQPSQGSTLLALLESRRGLFAQIAPKHLSPERLIKIALASVGRNETLQKCSQMSILQAVIQAAEVGLEIGGALQHSALVPFWNNKTNQFEAQFQLMYKGALQLVRNSGDVRDVQASVVYQKDKFRFERGLEPKLRHVPSLEADRGPITHVYAVVRFLSGGAEFDVMTKAEVDVIKAKVLARQKGNAKTWEDHYEEMAKKTVIKRCTKLCPVSAQAAEAIARDDELDRGEALAPIDIVALSSSQEPAKKQIGNGTPPAEDHDPETGEVVPPGDAATTPPPVEEPTPPNAPRASKEWVRAVDAINAAVAKHDLAAVEACAPLLKDIVNKSEHTDALVLYRKAKSDVQAAVGGSK
jgi:recombination protein RecT